MLLERGSWTKPTIGDSGNVEFAENNNTLRRQKNSVLS